MAKLKKLLVKKANDLIEARSYLTTSEKKAFAIAVAFAEKIVNEVHAVAEIDFDVLKKVLEEENFKIDKHFRDRLRRVLKGLVSKKEFALIEIPIEKYKKWLVENGKEDWIKTLGLEDYQEGFIFCGVIDDIVLSEDKKRIVVKFNRFISPMVLELRKRFTVYELKYILMLSTQYGPQLYELLKKNEFLGKLTIDVDKLKKILGADTPGYKYWTQFYERVLKPALDDINQKTDLNVQMNFIKGFHGKISKVEFTISSKKFFEEPSKIKSFLSSLASSLNVSVEELAYVLLSLERTNPAVALWFILHYPEGESRFFALEHLKAIEDNRKVKYPDKLLESLIKEKNPNLEWLLDQRNKDLIWKELEKIAKPVLEKKKREEETEKLFEEIVSTYRFLPIEGKLEILKNLEMDKEAFKNHLLELKEKMETEKLKEILKQLKNISEKYKDSFDDLLL